MAENTPSPTSAPRLTLLRIGDSAARPDGVAKDLFIQVAKDLDEKRTVDWANAFISFDAALRSIETADAQLFLSACFEQIVSILLNQHPSKINSYQKNEVVRSLNVAVLLLVRLLERKQFQFVTTLCQVFTKKQSFYSAAVPYWNKGAPEVRGQCVAAFFRAGGFVVLSNLLEEKAEAMISADAAKEFTEFFDASRGHILVQAISEHIDTLDLEAVVKLCAAVLLFLAKLPDDLLRKQPTESVGAIIGDIKHLLNGPLKGDGIIYKHWTLLTGAYISSSSLPQRLYGWEHINTLIDVARQANPLPACYTVMGAGAAEVNGEFILVPDTDANEVKYQKEGDDGHVLTLFRCAMRSGAKWWFISEADKEQPGTDKDIDFYQHQSIQDEFIPPSTGWVELTSAEDNPNQAGIPPAPTLIPQYSSNNDNDMLQTLETTLIAWVQQSNVVLNAFGDHIHREVVTRSAVLLNFLSSASALKLVHLDKIWGASLGGKQEVLVEEIQRLLVGLVQHLTDDLQAYFFNVLQSSLEEADNLANVVSFVEKLALSAPNAFKSSSATVIQAVLQLMWNLQQDFRIDIASEEFLHLFGETLCCPAAEPYRQKFLSECLGIIRSSAHSQTHQDNASAYLENKVSRSLESLKFLVESGDSCTLVDTLDGDHSLVQLLFDELSSSRLRTVGVHSVVTEECLKVVQQRLSVIHFVHGKSPALELSVAQVGHLWAILSTPAERELCLQFLSKAGVRNPPKLSEAFDIHVCKHVFQHLICKQTDFSTIGKQGYQCFDTYFKGLTQCSQGLVISREDDVKNLGLDTLWTICLTSPSSVADLARQDLFMLYEREPHFLKRVFSRLSKVAMQSATTAAVVGLSNADCICVQRCCQLLEGFVVRSPARMHGVPHGLAGQAQRFLVAVQGRRLLAHDAHNQGRSQAAQKHHEILRAIPLMVHPKETLITLRRRVSIAFQHPLQQLRLIMNSKQLQGGRKTLKSLGLQEGSQIVAVLYQSAQIVDAPEDDRDHPGDSFAENEEYFEVLFQILDCTTDTETCQQVWGLLMAVPTNKVLLQSIANSVAHDKVDWSTVLQDTSTHKLAYCLQIIEILLFPGSDDEVLYANAAAWSHAFFDESGFAHVLELFIAERLPKYAIAVVVHIFEICLDKGLLLLSDQDLSNVSGLLERHAQKRFISKLLSTALSPKDDKLAVGALRTLTKVIEWIASIAKGMDELILGIPRFSDLISNLMRHKSSTIRWQAAAAVEGISSVSGACDFTMLLKVFISVVNTINTSSPRCTELLGALNRIVVCRKTVRTMTEENDESLRLLATQIWVTLKSSTGAGSNTQENLAGYLQLLQTLIKNDPQILRDGMITALVPTVLLKFLLALPRKHRGKQWRPVCFEREARQAAFGLIRTVAEQDDTMFAEVVAVVREFIDVGSKSLQDKWEYDVSHAVRPENGYVGLKNQGCTCYMNSCLQQLYMVPHFRDKLQKARASVAQGDDAKSPLKVGDRIKLHWETDNWHEASITDFEESSGQHSLKYDDGQRVTFVLNEGRAGKESGQWRRVSVSSTEDQQILELLKQVQITMNHLKLSEKAWYDPEDLVAASSCLPLPGSVYQQHDADEYLKHLLDRIERSVKNTPYKTLVNDCFEVKMIHQKIAKGDTRCKQEREQTELFAPLDIRGKESIYESLEEIVKAELMDGDNQVEWEVNGQKEKKDTLLRVHFGTLPNILIAHLKRFYYDYNTDQDVKINSRCSFPLILDMKPYTKVGIAAAEAQIAMAAAGVEIPVEADDSDQSFNYRLHGVLIHSGVAQGGHYYSIIKEAGPHGKWYKFDDEEVTPFDSSQIEAECFGGMQTRTTNWHGTPQKMEVESFTNALLLFYEKVVPNVDIISKKQLTDDDEDNELFCEQVRASNLSFMTNVHLLDPELCALLGDLLKCRKSSDLLKLAIQFTLDVVLHAQNKQAGSSWLAELSQHFAQQPAVCQWFINELAQKPWLKLMLQCPDPSARAILAQILVKCVACLVENESSAHSLSKLVKSLVQLLQEARQPTCWQNLDECFIMLRDLAIGHEELRMNLCDQGGVLELASLFMEPAQPVVTSTPGAQHSDMAIPPPPPVKIRSRYLLEALSSMIGIPRVKRTPLLEIISLEEDSDIEDSLRSPELSAAAINAFKSIFAIHASTQTMNVSDLDTYLNNCGNGIRHRSQLIHNILEKYDCTADGQLTCMGFLEWQRDNATHTPEKVYRDLKCLGWQQDLVRQRDMNGPPVRHGIILPRNALAALKSVRFREKALMEVPNEAISILLILATDRLDDLLTLVKLLVKLCIRWRRESQSPMPGESNAGSSDPYVHALAQMLQATEGDQQQECMKEALIKDGGLIQIAFDRAQTARVYKNNFQAPQLVYWMIEAVLELRDQLPAAQQFLKVHSAEWSWMHEWLLQSSLEPPLGGQAQVRYRHATVVEVLNNLAEIHGFRLIEEPEDACFDGSSSPDTDTDTDS